MVGGAWWAAVHRVARSRTRLSDFTFTFHFYPLEKAMATHSRVLAWRIPGMEKPGGLLPLGLHGVGHDWSDAAAAAAAAGWIDFFLGYVSHPLRFLLLFLIKYCSRVNFLCPGIFFFNFSLMVLIPFFCLDLYGSFYFLGVILTRSWESEMINQCFQSFKYNQTILYHCFIILTIKNN